MEFAQRRVGDVVIVQVAGRLDSSAAQPAEEGLMRVLAAPSATTTSGAAPHLAIDMSNLQYISSAGLRVLLLVAKKAQQASRKVVLFGLLPNVREVFSISGFDQIFAIHHDAAAAVEAAAVG